jgi:ribosomal protein S18 acetylase RimI-like enzyme
MNPDSPMNVEAIADDHAARLGTVDSLLPPPVRFGPDSRGTVITASAGESAGSGLAASDEIAADARDALWRPLVEHRLTVRLGGPDTASAMSALLDEWEDHLAKTVRPGDWDTAAVVPRASRDSTGSAELLRHGFAPARVVAARPASRLVATGPAGTPGVRIRTAEHDDLATAVRLRLELERYDAQFGIVNLRADAEEAITAELAGLLEKDDPPVWIAELYGKALGMAQVQMPPDTEWIGRIVAPGRVGYLTSLAVAEEARSSGVGTALATHAHQVFDEAGTEVVLLHHALANPRSTPFWYAQGYRPLWTYWYRRPAVR